MAAVTEEGSGCVFTLEVDSFGGDLMLHQFVGMFAFARSSQNQGLAKELFWRFREKFEPPGRRGGEEENYQRHGSRIWCNACYSRSRVDRDGLAISPGA